MMVSWLLGWQSTHRDRSWNTQVLILNWRLSHNPVAQQQDTVTKCRKERNTGKRGDIMRARRGVSGPAYWHPCYWHSLGVDRCGPWPPPVSHRASSPCYEPGTGPVTSVKVTLYWSVTVLRISFGIAKYGTEQSVLYFVRICILPYQNSVRSLAKLKFALTIPNLFFKVFVSHSKEK